MTHKRAEYRLFPEAIPITRHGAGYSILTCAHSPISHFRALFSAFQGLLDFPSGKWKHPERRQNPKQPPPPPNPRGVKGYEEIRCYWIWIGTPYKFFLGNLPYFISMYRHGDLCLSFRWAYSLAHTKEMFLIWIDEYDGAEILSCYSLFHQELMIICTPTDTLPEFWSETDPPLQEINPDLD